MQTNDEWDWLKVTIPLLAVFIAQVVIIWKWFADSAEKRKEDKRTSKLNRLNQQLSDLYGPLYAHYETGEKNWFDFIGKYSNDPMPVVEFKRFFQEERVFPEPNEEQLKAYRLYMKTIFMPTNIAMEEVIVNKAELLVGKTMPDCLLKLCVHIASNKPLMEKWNEEGFDESSVENHKSGFAHPGFEVREYIQASFSVLKEEQELIINRIKEDINEQDLEERIDKRVKKLRLEREARKLKAERLLTHNKGGLIPIAEPVQTEKISVD